MRPGLPAWHNLASQNEKYAYRYQNMTSHHGLTKRVPHRQLRPNLRYAIHFPSLQNGLINCFNVSLGLIVFEQYFIIRFALIVYDICEAKRNSLFRLR